MLRTFPEVLRDVLDRAEEETGFNQSEFYGLASQAIDRVYHDILELRPWLWAKSPFPFIVNVRKPIGVSVTWLNGSTTATTNIPLPTPVADWKILVKGASYRVLAGQVTQIPELTPLIMETTWKKASLAGEPATAYRDEYDLLEVLDPPAAPTLQTTPGSGAMPASSYSYACTYIGSVGETTLGPFATGNLAVEGGFVLALPKPTTPNPLALGWGIYRSEPVNQHFQLVARHFPDYRTLRDDSTYHDIAATLEPDAAPLPAGENKTVRVREITMLKAKGAAREVDYLPEAELHYRYPDPPSPRWPPVACARIAEARIRLSHYPTADNALEVHHTQIGRPLSQSTPNEILIPLQDLVVVADGALGLLLEQKHQDRAKYWLDKMSARLDVMGAEDDRKRRGYETVRRTGSRHGFNR
jgi:hypothetical protein